MSRHENRGNPIFAQWTSKWFPLSHLNGVLENILVCVQFSSKLAKLPNVYGLSCSYFDFRDTSFFHFTYV